MKKKHAAQIAPTRRSLSEGGFFNLRASITLLICAAAACSVLAGGLLAFFRPETQTNVFHRTLTFAERVAYQRAIEEVYWHHRIWPTERPDPKPSLDAVMSQAQLERKVTDYLHKSQALEGYWQEPITSQQLQAEMDRIAKHTKRPDVLRELFQTLGNDPFVTAECLARPVLAERLVADLSAHDKDRRFALRRTRTSGSKPSIRTLSEATYTLPEIDPCIDDTWTATSITNAPSARWLHRAVWTGSEMIVWGGSNNSGFLNTGGRYDPSTDSWTATTTVNAPSARESPAVVWTGSEMIVWGGFGAGAWLNTGGRYNPSTDSWVATSTSGAPAARNQHTAVWTGTEMIVWGGLGNPTFLNSGGRYNPSTDSWTATSTTNAPSARDDHTAVWTGGEMVIWGGYNNDPLSTGGRYNPATDSWTPTSAASAPFARYRHSGAWTGTEMIVWGGSNSSNYLNTGGRYTPANDTWTATGTANAPDARWNHTAIWTGSEMIIWGGGTTIGTNFNTGGRYDPGTDSWIATSLTNAPTARQYHTAIWTGAEMIVWGGNGGSYLNTGGRYCAQPPPTPTPTPTATVSPTPTPTGSPTPRIITVINTNDSGPGSLRQALFDANDGDTINFAVTGEIGLTSGELVIDRDITISGPGSNSLTVRPSQTGSFRVFDVMQGHSITIQGLTISFGYAEFAQGGGIYLGEQVTATIADCSLTNNYTGDIGGAIYIDGYGGGAALTVLNSTISGNTAGTTSHGGSGAGIYSTATLTIINSTLTNNTAFNDSDFFGGQGGGILSGNEAGGTLEISNTTISSNQAGVGGGGLCLLSGTATITNSTISGNTAGLPFPPIGVGGGIYSGGRLTITNSTISGNQANGSTFKGGGLGGGIYAVRLDIRNSTVNGNSASVDGGSIYGGTVGIGNTILNAGTPENFNSGGTVTSLGYNVCSDNGGGYLNGPGDQINTNPLLGSLQDNGGPTFTHALSPGSPAIDAGDPNFTPPPYYDQRGPVFWRVRNGRIDVGSFEVQAGSTPTPTPTPTASPTPTPTATFTPTATATFTPTPTVTATATPTATITPTARSTPTARPKVTPRTRPTPPPRL